MEIIISDDRTLNDIKDEFQSHYPNLQLKFFKKKHGAFEGSEIGDEINGNIPVGRARRRQNEGRLNIHPFQTVAAVEQLFESKFGLHVQVLRRAGREWLLTTSTDGWTLMKQNEIGGELLNGIEK